MDPPTYEEARLHPAVSPPPSYDASLSSPSTPPPTYGEAVTQERDPFPILTPPHVPTPTVTPAASGARRVTVHPTTFIGVRPPETSRTQPGVVTSQPQSGTTRSVAYLRDDPQAVVCPHCHERVTTDVDHKPGMAAWCLCCLMAMMGLICGFCLIPLVVRGLQEAHHSCPQCGHLIYIYSK